MRCIYSFTAMHYFFFFFLEAIIFFCKNFGRVFCFAVNFLAGFFFFVCPGMSLLRFDRFQSKCTPVVLFNVCFPRTSSFVRSLRLLMILSHRYLLYRFWVLNIGCRLLLFLEARNRVASQVVLLNQH